MSKCCLIWYNGKLPFWLGCWLMSSNVSFNSSNNVIKAIDECSNSGNVRGKDPEKFGMFKLVFGGIADQKRGKFLNVIATWLVSTWYSTDHDGNEIPAFIAKYSIIVVGTSEYP